jgi:hypothetical protein
MEETFTFNHKSIHTASHRLSTIHSLSRPHQSKNIGTKPEENPHGEKRSGTSGKQNW